MTLHPALRAELLDDELGVARARLGTRVTGIERRDALIRVPLSAPDGGPVFLTLDGSNYDAEPFELYVTEPDGVVAPPARWPGQLAQAMHPVLVRPFLCIRAATSTHLSRPPSGPLGHRTRHAAPCRVARSCTS